MEKAYVFLADGFEEIEGLTVVDILRRARCGDTDGIDYGTKEVHRQSRDPVCCRCTV